MTSQSIKEIQDVIAGMVADKINAGECVNMHWATMEILNTYNGITGRDVDFYFITAKYYITDQVKRCIKKWDPSEEQQGGQIVLEGFEHLQKAYPVDRGDGRELIPVDQLSDDELEERAIEYERMAAGCMAHAFEIREYIRRRREVA